MKKFFGWIIVLMFGFGAVGADSNHDFTQAKEIVDSKVPCSELTKDQLERIGDYYMENMHPGDAHGSMDEMMGGEGSESLRQAHISIAKRDYCGYFDRSGKYMAGGMMENWGMGMMVPYSAGHFYWFNAIVWILLIIGIVFLIKWLATKQDTKKNKKKLEKKGGGFH